MSYSFDAKGATKAEAKAAVEAKFDEIVGFDTIHARDKAAVLANAGAVIDLLADDETKDISVSCHGHLGWDGTHDEPKITGANLACYAQLIARE